MIAKNGSGQMSKGCDHAGGAMHTGEAPVLASATVGARRWLLIEHNGPWAAYLPECRLPESVLALIDRATALGIRSQLIRRPDRETTQGPRPLHVFVGSSTGNDPGWQRPGSTTQTILTWAHLWTERFRSPAYFSE